MSFLIAFKSKPLAAELAEKRQVVVMDLDVVPHVAGLG
jgi:hypothetical protein